MEKMNPKSAKQELQAFSVRNTYSDISARVSKPDGLILEQWISIDLRRVIFFRYTRLGYELRMGVESKLIRSDVSALIQHLGIDVESAPKIVKEFFETLALSMFSHSHLPGKSSDIPCSEITATNGEVLDLAFSELSSDVGSVSDLASLEKMLWRTHNQFDWQLSGYLIRSIQLAALCARVGSLSHFAQKVEKLYTEKPLMDQRMHGTSQRFFQRLSDAAQRLCK